jgi:hypothetical protein
MFWALCLVISTVALWRPHVEGLVEKITIKTFYKIGIYLNTTAMLSDLSLHRANVTEAVSMSGLSPHERYTLAKLIDTIVSTSFLLLDALESSILTIAVLCIAVFFLLICFLMLHLRAKAATAEIAAIKKATPTRAEDYEKKVRFADPIMSVLYMHQA